MISITKNDDLDLFRETFEQKDLNEWRNLLVENKSKRILLYLLNTEPSIEEFIKKEIGIWRPKDEKIFLLDLLSERYGINRFYNEVDTLPLAIRYHYVEWIKGLPKESFLHPITLKPFHHIDSKQIHPISYVFETIPYLNSDGTIGNYDILNEIVTYLLSIYNESLNDILYQLVVNRSIHGVNYIVSYHRFSKDVIGEAISIVRANEDEDGFSKGFISILCCGILPADPLPSFKISLKI